MEIKKENLMEQLRLIKEKKAMALEQNQFEWAAVLRDEEKKIEANIEAFNKVE